MLIERASTEEYGEVNFFHQLTDLPVFENNTTKSMLTPCSVRGNKYNGEKRRVTSHKTGSTLKQREQ